MKKQVFIFSILSLFPLSANAQEATFPSCGPNCTYTIENNVLTVKPIDETKPASVQSYVRQGSPWYGQNITKIDIQEGITNIGYSAFEDMTSVTSVSLPEGLKTIEGESFHGTRITSLEIPSTVTSIGKFAFAISTLKEINALPEGLTSIATETFANTKITDLVIPAGVTSISSSAFGHNGDYWNRSSIKNLYCEESIADQCAQVLKWRKDNGADVKVTTYQASSNGQFFYNNRWYNSANDILSGDYAKKRIYTVDEANKVTSKKNKVMIRYK
ncbi:MAG: leucine-rich repeat domain-containing protein [Alphaproteobacteria bacterium]|nr:leucine-rich repeat domain-containing protein [Alphaproteobacteria bacterium]